MFTNNNTRYNLQSNMPQSNSLRAKNTGIGATNPLWTTRVWDYCDSGERVIGDDIRHFTVSTRAALNGDLPKASADLYHGISNDLYVIPPYGWGGLGPYFDPEICLNDRIHAGTDHVAQYHGTVISVYPPQPRPPVFVNRGPRAAGGRRKRRAPPPPVPQCLIEWDIDRGNTAEWRRVAPGIVIPSLSHQVHSL